MRKQKKFGNKNHKWAVSEHACDHHLTNYLTNKTKNEFTMIEKSILNVFALDCVKKSGLVDLSSAAYEKLTFRPSQVSTDTRTVKKGDLFIALNGKTYDGNQFVLEAFSKNASLIVCNKAWFKTYEMSLSSDMKERLIPVSDTLQFYKQLALQHRSLLTGTKVISLTGSYGKTTVKEMLRITLSKFGKVSATQKNENNDIGAAKTLLSITSDCDFSVVEMGARHVGDIGKLVEYARPDIALVTNVGSAHIGEMGSLDNIYKTKLEMFSKSPPGCLKVGLHDDQKILSVLKKYPNHITFGQNPQATVSYRNPHNDGSRTIYEFVIGEKTYVITTTFSHTGFASNAALVLCVCFSLGLDLDTACSALSEFDGLDGRFKIFRKHGQMFIDDTYNASHESVINGLDSLDKLFDLEKMVLVLGDILELGEMGKKIHQDIGKHIQAHLKGVSIVTLGPLARHISSEAIKNGFNPTRVIAYNDIDQLLGDLSNILAKGQFFYLKASNGMGLFKAVAKIKTSEVEI